MMIDDWYIPVFLHGFVTSVHRRDQQDEPTIGWFGRLRRVCMA